MYLSVLNYINTCIKEKRDFTINLDNSGKIKTPHSGFVVSITPLINIGMDTVDIIIYIIDNKYISIDSKKYNLYLGGWFENNTEKLIPDISIVTTTLEEAIQIGKHCSQNAVYDISNKNTIYLNNSTR